MTIMLEEEFPYVWDYPMIEPPASKSQMDEIRDGYEIACSEGRSLEEPGDHTLYTTPENYMLNRLILWMARNKHMYVDGGGVPPGYDRRPLS